MPEKRRNIFRTLAREAGVSERDYLGRLLNQHGNQKSIALALGISQSSVSQAFKRHNIKPVIKYEVQ